jgi:hypothetical protein
MMTHLSVGFFTPMGFFLLSSCLAGSVLAQPYKNKTYSSKVLQCGEASFQVVS